MAFDIMVKFQKIVALCEKYMHCGCVDCPMRKEGGNWCPVNTVLRETAV